MDKNFRGTTEEYKEFRKRSNEANRRYYNKPEVKAKKRIYKKEYDKINKDKISEYGRKLRARLEYKERVKNWRKENRESLIKRGKEWREKNKEYKNRKDREYQRRITKDPILREKRLAYQKKNREENKDKIKSYNQKYNNSEKGKIKYTRHNHLRLSKKFGNEFSLSAEEIKKIHKRDKICVYCGFNKFQELDHIIPISKGGKSNYNNFVIACRSCNSSKANKDVFIWCKEKGIEVPKIIIELLEKQNQGVQIISPTKSERDFLDSQ